MFFVAESITGRAEESLNLRVRLVMGHGEGRGDRWLVFHRWTRQHISRCFLVDDYFTAPRGQLDQ